jgi:hypothetical protein
LIIRDGVFKGNHLCPTVVPFRAGIHATGVGVQAQSSGWTCSFYQVGPGVSNDNDEIPYHPAISGPTTVPNFCTHPMPLGGIVHGSGGRSGGCLACLSFSRCLPDRRTDGWIRCSVQRPAVGPARTPAPTCPSWSGKGPVAQRVQGQARPFGPLTAVRRRVTARWTGCLRCCCA